MLLAQNYANQQQNWQTMSDNFGLMKKGGNIKFQRGGLQIKESANTETPWELTEAQKEGYKVASKLFMDNNGNLIKVKQAIDSMKREGKLPSSIKNIRVQPLGWQHYVVYHPHKSLQELEEMTRKGLQDDEQRVVVGVESDDNYFNSNYPIEIGIAKAENKKAGATYGKVTDDERIALERKVNKQKVYEDAVKRTKDMILKNWDKLPEWLKEHYKKTIPDVVANKKVGGKLQLGKLLVKIPEKSYLEQQIELRFPTNTKMMNEDNEYDYESSMKKITKYVTNNENFEDDEFLDFLKENYPDLLSKFDNSIEPDYTDVDVNRLKKIYENYYKIKPKKPLIEVNKPSKIDLKLGYVRYPNRNNSIYRSNFN